MRTWQAAEGARAASSLLIGLALVGWAASAHAQARRAFDVQRFVPALDASGFLGVPGTRTPGPLRTSFALFADYALAPLEEELPTGEELDLVEHRIGMSASGQLGLGQRAAIGVRVPFVLYQSGESLAGARELAPVAIADPSLLGRYRLIGEASEDPLLPKDGPGLALELESTIPVGAEDAYAGEGATRASARLAFDVQLLGAGVGGVVGYRHRFGSRELAGDDVDGEMTFGAGLKMPLPSLHPLIAVAELRGATDFRSSTATALEGEIGLRAAFGELVITLAGGAGLSGSFGVPDARAVLGVWYAPAPTDVDHDGVDDDEDRCAPLPEDHDGFADDDGCPDPDNDNDLVPDVDDLCPLEEALEGQDEDEDGCTDAAS